MRYLALIVFNLMLCLSPQQIGQRGYIPATTSTPLPPATPPTFQQYTYVPENASSVTSVTSSSISVGKNDLIIINCRGGSNVTSSVGTTSWTYAPSGSTVALLFAYTTAASSAATFTCNYPGGANYTSMLVLDYLPSNSGISSTVVGTAYLNTFSNASITQTTTMTTSARALIVTCATPYSAGGLYTTGGTFAGNAMTLEGYTSSGLTFGMDMACSDYASTSAQSSISVTNPIYNQGVTGSFAVVAISY